MDSAKSKYIVFLPEVLKRLKLVVVVVFDDVFQGGDIVKPIEKCAAVNEQFTVVFNIF